MESRTFKTNKEAAEYIRSSEVTLYRLRRDGVLPFYRVQSKILFDQADLDEYLANRRRHNIAGAEVGI